MDMAQLVIRDDALTIAIDLSKVPELRRWQDAAERAHQQWEESEWFLGEARASLHRTETELRAVGEAYHELQAAHEAAAAQREQAVQLARIIEDEDWGGEQPIVYDDQEEMDDALGTGRQEYGLLSIWWD